MKILIIGGGGREHALAWRLAASAAQPDLFAIPGNPGIAQIATCLTAPVSTVADYAAIAEVHNIDLTVVGPEAPLVAGVVDEFRRRGLKTIGPTQAAARLEGSKIFAKQFFERANIPTARTGTDINDFSFPFVVKTDGLAAGKGVVIVHNRNEADQAISALGPNLLLEEFLQGEEVSFMGLSDGLRFVPFAPTQDHKQVRDNDEGPNTGGMGAYCDTRILTSGQGGEVMERIMLPAIRQMRAEKTPFTGFLYAGLMMTAEGPKVLEFNVRLGDPETQALLYSLEGDLVELLSAAASSGDTLPTPRWTDPSACIVLASEGYPARSRSGDEIKGVERAEAAGATVFHAGTAFRDGHLVTNGGRVLGVTARDAELPGALQKAYRAVQEVSFPGMHFRRDIGAKGLRRW